MKLRVDHAYKIIEDKGICVFTVTEIKEGEDGKIIICDDLLFSKTSVNNGTAEMFSNLSEGWTFDDVYHKTSDKSNYTEIFHLGRIKTRKQLSETHPELFL